MNIDEWKCPKCGWNTKEHVTVYEWNSWGPLRVSLIEVQQGLPGPKTFLRLQCPRCLYFEYVDTCDNETEAES